MTNMACHPLNWLPSALHLRSLRHILWTCNDPNYVVGACGDSKLQVYNISLGNSGWRVLLLLYLPVHATTVWRVDFCSWLSSCPGKKEIVCSIRKKHKVGPLCPQVTTYKNDYLFFLCSQSKWRHRRARPNSAFFGSAVLAGLWKSGLFISTAKGEQTNRDRQLLWLSCPVHLISYTYLKPTVICS